MSRMNWGMAAKRVAIARHGAVRISPEIICPVFAPTWQKVFASKTSRQSRPETKRPTRNSGAVNRIRVMREQFEFMRLLRATKPQVPKF